MSRLTYTQEKQQDIKTCEICGTRFIAGYGYSLALSWLVTGHAWVGAFLCKEPEGNQHWGCSPEHAVEAAIACAQEHMHPQLLAKHQEQTDKGHSRTALEDEYLLAKGENFHIVQ